MDTARSASKTSSSASSSPESAVELSREQCLVCYSDLTGHVGITPCGHDNVCGVCHLRLRNLHRDKKCPMCKEENQIIIVDQPGKSYEEYPIWGNELGPEFTYREHEGMFFNLAYYNQEILPLFGYHCSMCAYDGTTPDVTDGEKNTKRNRRRPRQKAKPQLRQLQHHLRRKHGLALCQLCVDFERDFVSRLPRYSPSQLKRHLVIGDGHGSGFAGHPVCKFCRPKRFYDLTQLYAHLQKEHYKCHLCEQQGRQNQYFCDYVSLERHFDKTHFLCHDVQCLEARFMVFQNELDLRRHEIDIHGRTSTGSSKINLDFRVKRAGDDGAGVANTDGRNTHDGGSTFGLDDEEVFVPEELLPQESNQATHPLHVARTAEISANAARIRQQLQVGGQHGQEADKNFPSLNGSVDKVPVHNSLLRMGWTTTGDALGMGRTSVDEAASAEQFPYLPKTKNRKDNAATNLHAKERFSSLSSARTAESVEKSSNSMSSIVVHPAAVAAATSNGAKPPAKLPNLNDFPPPLQTSSSSKSGKSVREKMLGNPKGPSKEALANVLEFRARGRKKQGPAPTLNPLRPYTSVRPAVVSNKPTSAWHVGGAPVLPVP